MSYQYKSDLPEKTKEYQQEIRQKMPGILAKMAVTYGAKALEYAPPGMTNKKAGTSGKKIAKKFYERNWIYLPDEVKKPNNKLSKFDLQMMNKKYFYRLESARELSGASSKSRQVKRRKGTVYFYYFKTLRPLKHWIKIQNRGLLKVMFGLNLESIKQAIPGAIKSLLNKSKNLAKLVSLNRFTQTQNGLESGLKIENLAFTDLCSQNLQNIVNKNAEKYAEKTAKKELKKIADEEKNL